MGRRSGFLAVLALLGMAGCGDAVANVEGTKSLPDVAMVDPPAQPKSTWAAQILTDGKIPEDGFLAAYFDRSATVPTFHTSQVDTIAVKYAWDELHDIRSDDFAAYWIGQIEVAEPGWHTISVNESRAKSRIFVDGVQVYPVEADLPRERPEPRSRDFIPRRPPPAPSPGMRGEIPRFLDAGKHLIEVEFLNNWHTTEYKVVVSRGRRTQLDDAELLAETSRWSGGEVHYVGLYESDERDTSVAVDLPPTGRPAILWLDSYEAIDWSINAPDGVEGIVIASYSPGSRVVEPSDVPVLYARTRLGIREIGESGGCTCHSGHFHCEQRNGVDALPARMEQLTGKMLAGFGTAYSASDLSVRRFGTEEKRRAELSARNRERARAECQAQANPDFDTLLD